MGGSLRIALGDFLVDPEARRLWQGNVAISLRPKPWDLLLCLLARPGQVLLKEEIAAAVWPGVVVGEDSIAKAVRELRTALGDDARQPRFLETVHRVGFRLIAEVEAKPGATAKGIEAAPSPGHVTPSSLPSHAQTNNAERAAPRQQPARARIAGRASQLAGIHEAWERAKQGSRQTLFLAGEGGIGKSTVVRAFLDDLALSGDPPRILFGQSAEAMALADAYAPLLDALQMARAEHEDAELEELMTRLAPAWLAQAPDYEGARTEGSGSAAAARMLREGVLLLEALAARRPLVLVVEDAHCADHATIDLLSTLAGRPSQAKLLVLATFRRAEAVAARHPVAASSAELELKGLARAIAIGPFERSDARRLLELRFGPMENTGDLEALLLRRSGGNPLFLSALLDYLVSSGTLTEDDGVWTLTTSVQTLVDVVPDRLRLIVNAILSRLDPTTAEMLEVAAVAGHDFDARSIAAALGRDPREVEAACDRLAADEQLLRFRGEGTWRDGTHGARYEFLHQLYKEVLYARVSPSRRREAHLRIAERLESGALQDAPVIASDLAMHFARGGDNRRAIRYLLRSGERANRRGAHRDAVVAFRQAVQLMDPDPSDPRDAFRLLRMQMTLAGSLSFVTGMADPELDGLLERSRALADRIGALPASGIIELGIFTLKLLRSTPQEALASATRMLELAGTIGIPMLHGAALGAHGWGLFASGDFLAARERFDEALGLDLADFDFNEVGALGAMPEMRIWSLLGRAFAGAVAGDVKAAAADAAAAVDQTDAARSTERIGSLSCAAFVHAMLGDDRRAAACTAEARRIIEDGVEHTTWGVGGMVVEAICWSPPSIEKFSGALRAWDSQYRWFGTMFRLMMAERLLARGDRVTARSLVDSCAARDETTWKAVELRMRAEVLLAESATNTAEAQDLLRESCRVAASQNAGLWEAQARVALERSSVPKAG